MRKETLERLIRQYDGNDLVGHICHLLEEDRELRRRMRQHCEAERGLEEEIKESRLVGKERLRDIRIDCPHHETTFHSDPSGGNDSYRDCDLCGKQIF